VSHRVVCISGTEGAEGDAVARLVADGLGFLLVDEAIVARAAQAAGVEPEVVADVELRKSFLKRLLDDLGSSAGVSALAVGGGFIPADDELPPSDELRVLIRAAIEETAARGDAVIVAHAASIALGERDDVLRVLVTGSADVRRRRLIEASGLSEEEAAAALKASDAGRASYLRTFYGVSDERPTHYDLVVNTDRLTPAAAASLVVEACEAGARPAQA
jgi:sulfur carrier protein ThiS